MSCCICVVTDESILRKFCAATTEERKTVNIQKYIEVIRIFFIGLKLLRTCWIEK